jgi:hypothetical protein
MAIMIVVIPLRVAKQQAAAQRAVKATLDGIIARVEREDYARRMEPVMRREAVRGALESMVRRLEVEEQRVNMCTFVLKDVLTRVENHVCRNAPLFPPSFLANSTLSSPKLYGRPHPKGCLYATLYAPPHPCQPRPQAPVIHRPVLLQPRPAVVWHAPRPLTARPSVPTVPTVGPGTQALTPRPKAPTFPCPVCKRHFSSKQYLHQHCRSQHGREPAVASESNS